MIVTQFDLLAKRYRANLINSISGFKSANLIGTINGSGRTNLGVFNSVMHIGATPPLLGFIMRPLNAPRHTYQNIKEMGIYTINHINNNIYEQAHQTSAKYDAGESEFDTCSLTEEYVEGLAAPFVKESIIKMGMEFVEEHHIKANDTLLIVGEIKQLICPEEIIEEDGYVNIEKANTVTISNLDGYHKTDLIERLPYARPK